MVNPIRALFSGLTEVEKTRISCRTKDNPVVDGHGRELDGKIQVITAVEVLGAAPPAAGDQMGEVFEFVFRFKPTPHP